MRCLHDCTGGDTRVSLRAYVQHDPPSTSVHHLHSHRHAFGGFLVVTELIASLRQAQEMEEISVKGQIFIIVNLLHVETHSHSIT